MSNLYKPGEDNKPAGKYEEVGPRGGKVPNGNNATIDKGDRLPPTSEKGHKWKKK
ncbi:YjzC family protein [Marinilactibacillus sp. XAAS-LB27]|uniref:YjzC family protein n=1 Tax=Marinilactibacillus sp. XAAS-LB27 TaxID=3114538 RepID=UPI002E19FD26|nr:YjzC family protein [Marinilactibacillus sp. XAAS-LB27]